MTTALQRDWNELRIPAHDLCIGDHIVVKRNNAGLPTSVVTISKLEYGTSCKGMHVNPKYATPPPGHKQPGIYTSMLLSCDGCYDGAALIDVIRFSEDAPHV